VKLIAELQKQKIQKLIPFIILAFLLLLTVKFLAYEINRPWVGHRDFNGAVWSNVARNYNRYGFIATKFGQVNNYGALAPQTFSYYIHHPPLLPILVAISFRIFGESEAAARYVPIAFSLGALIFVFLLSRRFWGILGATISSAALIATPQYLYFGRMVNHEPLTFFFIVAATYFYVLWKEKPSRLHFSLFTVMLIGGGLSGWPMHLFMGSVFILDVFAERRVRKPILIVPLVGVILLGLFLVHASILKGSGNAFTDLLDILKVRTGQVPESGGFSWASLAERMYLWLKYEFGWPLLILSVLGIVGAALIGTAQAKRFLGLVVMLFLVAVLYILLFPHGAWNHDYWSYYLLAPLALSAAVWGSFSLGKQWINVAALVTSLLLLGALASLSVQVTDRMYRVAVNYGYEMFGSAVHNHSDLDTIVLTDLPFVGPEANYYADREIAVGVDTVGKLNDAMQRYKGKDVIFADAGTSAELQKYLASRYPSNDVSGLGLKFFHLSERATRQ